MDHFDRTTLPGPTVEALEEEQLQGRSPPEANMSYASAVGNQALQSEIEGGICYTTTLPYYDEEAQMSIMPAYTDPVTPVEVSVPPQLTLLPPPQTAAAQVSQAGAPGAPGTTAVTAAPGVTPGPPAAPGRGQAAAAGQPGAPGTGAPTTGAPTTGAPGRPGKAGGGGTAAPAAGGRGTAIQGSQPGGQGSGLPATGGDLISGMAELAVLPPLSLPTAPTLEPMPMTAPFVMPAPPQRQQTVSVGMAAPAGERVFQEALYAYETAAAGMQSRHDAVAAQGAAAVAGLEQMLEQFRYEAPMLLINADMLVEMEMQRAQEQVNLAADASDRAIAQAHQDARRVVIGAGATARKKVKDNADTFDKQGEKVIDSLSKGRVDKLYQMELDIADLSFKADDAIQAWLRDIGSTYPKIGSDLTPARHETYQAVAPSLATAVRGHIAERASAMGGDLAAAAGQVRQGISDAVKPAFDNQRDKTRTEGMKQVEDAVSAALSGLRQQSRAARQAVSEMRDAAQGQLAAQRRSARAQLEAQAAQALTDAHRQVAAAREQILQSLTMALPLYGNAAQDLRQTLNNAGGGGPEALRAISAEVIPAVESSVAAGHEAQRAQIEAIVMGVNLGMGQLRLQLDSGLATHVIDNNRAMSDGARASTDMLITTGVSMTAGFVSAADGVNRTAAFWATPLEKLFAEAIKDVETQIKEKDPEFEKQISDDTKPLRDYLTNYHKPKEPLEKPGLSETFVPVQENLQSRVSTLEGKLRTSWYQNTDEGGITGAFHGLTWAKGIGVKYLWFSRHETSLIDELAEELNGDSDDFEAAVNYLAGNAEAGALAEMRASVRWYNDDEARIERAQRALSPEQITRLQTLPGAADVLSDTRDALGGVDRDVFDALKAGDYALADTLRMKEKLDAARRKNDADAVNDILTAYSKAPDPKDWGFQTTITAEARWGAIQEDFRSLKGVSAKEGATAAETMRDYVLRDIEVQRGGGRGERYTQTLRVEGRQRDLATAIIMKGGESIEARVARIGVEQERKGGPNILNLDTALVDERLNPANNVPEHIREEARKEREEVLRKYAETYGGPGATADLNSARADLIRQLRERAGSDTAKADLAAALVEEEHPSPATAAIAMEYAQAGAGTREDVIWRFTERMSRKQLAEMRQKYDASGRDLYADLGLFGKGGWFTELSGDDRLRAEKAMWGRPTNDREKAEVAAYAMFQQQKETGAVGRWWAEGSLAEESLKYDERRLRELTGGTIEFGANGEPPPEGESAIKNSEAFDSDGKFLGDRAEFSGTIVAAQQSAQNYAAEIDKMAGVVTMAIAIAGAIVAAVVTVATGGAASPLLMAAIAGVTGAASMGAQAAIKGGRYGWEQAAVDLGMTAVDMLTAGVGQGMSLASRGGMQGLRAGMGLARTAGTKGTGMLAQMGIRNARQLAVANLDDTTRLLGKMGKLTGTEFGDRLLIGGTTGGIGGLGRTALDEKTYEKGGAKATDNLFAGLFRGVLSGTATAGVAGAFDFAAPNMGASTSVFGRGLFEAGTGGAGAFVGRLMELGYDASRGEYLGDAGDAFVTALQAAAQGAAQGKLEGALGARAQRGFGRFSRPFDEQLQANQLRKQFAEAGSDPIALQAVLDQIAKAPPGVLAQLADPLAPFGPLVRPPVAAPEAAPGEAAAGVTPPVTRPPETGAEPTRPMPPGETPAPGLPRVQDVAAPEPAAGVPARPPVQPEKAAVVRNEAGELVSAASLLPPDLRNRVPVQMDPTLTGNEVRVLRRPQLHIRVGPEATAADIALHIGTARDFRRGEGLIGLVNRALGRMVGDPPPESVAGEAYQELDKLPGIIEDRMRRLQVATEPVERQQLSRELDSLYAQYRQHADAAMSGDRKPGRGYVAMADTRKQIDDLYGAEARPAITDPIEADLVLLFPDKAKREKALADMISDRPGGDAAKIVLATDIHRLVLQLQAKDRQPGMVKFSARLVKDLASNDPETRQGAGLMLKYFSNNFGEIQGGRKSLRPLNEVLELFSSQQLGRLAALHKGVGPTKLVESLSEIVRSLDTSSDADAKLALTVAEHRKHGRQAEANALLAERSAFRKEFHREQITALINQLKAESVANPIGMLARHVRRVRLQDPSAVITAQRLRASIELERQIAALSRSKDFKAELVYETLHGGGPVRTTFTEKSEVYQYFRNKMKDSEETDQSFQANALIEAVARTTKSESDPEFLGRWKALHDFIAGEPPGRGLPITINGQPMTRGEKRAMLGHVWEDIYMRTVMNALGDPDVFNAGKGILWSYHMRIDGANFDAIIVRVVGKEVIIDVVDAKLSGAPLSDKQDKVVPKLEDLEVQTTNNGTTLAKLLQELPDGTGSGTGISKLFDQLVRDGFNGNLPPDVRFKVRFRRAESQE